MQTPETLEARPNPYPAKVAELVAALRSERIRTQPTLGGTLAMLNPVVEEIRLIVGQEVAESLNRFAGQPIGDLVEKRQTSAGISDLLDSLGLKVKCPKTGQATTLMSHPRSDHHPDGYFKTVACSPPYHGTRVRVLPRIEVMPRDVRAKPLRRSSGDVPWER